jgi:hypothetical protein
MDLWPFWMFEENIKIVNEIVDEENKEREKQEKSQGDMPNFNPNSMMNNASSMMNSVPKY